jgi:hypothetical protein
MKPWVSDDPDLMRAVLSPGEVYCLTPGCGCNLSGYNEDELRAAYFDHIAAEHAATE